MTRPSSICREVLGIPIFKISYDILYFLAYDLAREQKRNFGDDIACLLRLAKKKRFSIQEEKRIAQEIELQSHLSKLLRRDCDAQLDKLEETEPDTESVTEKTRQIEEQYENYMTELNNIFVKIDDRRRVSIICTVLRFFNNLILTLLFLEKRSSRLFMWKNKF